MNCVKCGAEIEEGSRFCEVCGTPVGNQAENIPRDWQTENDLPEGPFIPGGFGAKRIRKWFKGRPVWPVVITVIGLILVWLGGTSLLPVLVIGAVCWVITWMGTSDADVAIVDEAWNYYAGALGKRGMEKLNLIQEQVDMIDPVIVTGRGMSPSETFAAAKEQKRSRGLLGFVFGKIIGCLFWIVFAIINIFKNDETAMDPYEAYRIAGDDCLRSMLMQLSVYMFTDAQVLRYKANIDISTGLIYEESTDEIFYQDIEGINFSQEVYKIYNRRKKKFENRVLESIELFLGGCRLSSNLSMNASHSVIDQQFAAMRSLIRDKKNS